jgi:CubicO group peptidase (beta-lactamase class C family)
MPSTAVEPGGFWATGYKQRKDGSYKLEDPFPWEPWGAAGALRSNALDMLNFLTANICAHHPSDPACAGLPQDILTALATAHRPNTYTPSGSLADPNIYIGGEGSGVEQGWAWRYLEPPDPNPDNVTPIISKDGGHPGFSTYIGFNPHKAYGLVILMNTGGVAAKAAGKEIIQHTP